ncbi:MAG: AraC family transcriptional regulator [Bacillaceae bacterium]|nr:AraC family transcriptional regulator [Bacillaceae bacterium]
MNVLLLDDEPLELEQMELLITRHYPDWHIKKAMNATTAIHTLEDIKENQESVHLAFIDIRLPGKSGLEVAEVSKQIHPNIDIIIVSAYQDFHYAKSSIQLGVVDYLVKPIIEEELVRLLKGYMKKHPEFQVQSDIIHQVIKRVQKRYAEQLRLSDVAKELHINNSYLSRRFSEEMGISFSDYLLNYRIEVAQKFLKEKDWSIQRVAEETGFNSQHYFSTVFKKQTGKTPKDYRNLHR